MVFILAALILLPLQQRVACQTGLGALFFVANIVLARNTRGYFDAPAERCQYQPWVGPRAQCTESSAPYFSKYREYLALLTEAVTVRDNVHLLNTSDGICDDQVCSMTNDGNLFFADEGHFNEIGSEWVIAQQLTNVLVFQEALRGK